MTVVEIRPSRLSGRVAVPPSKSHSLRAILLASMAAGVSQVSGVLASPDMAAMITACRQLGAHIRKVGCDLTITGVGGRPRVPDNVIDAGNSGQVLRFASAMAALAPGYTIMTGDYSARHNRPVRPLMDGINQLGGECLSTRGDDHAPLIINGPIAPGDMAIDGADSQPVSAFLMAAAFMEGESRIRVRNVGEKPWIGLTLDWLDRLGVGYEREDFRSYVVYGTGAPRGFDFSVPGDLSAAAFPLVGALVTESEVIVANADMADSQGDKKIISALRTMGATIEIDGRAKTVSVRAKSRLIGADLDINDFIDALPILAVAACYGKKITTLKNCAIARKKECDRLSAISTELTKMGAQVFEAEDQLTIHPSTLTGGDLNTYHDHRMAMSLGVAALGAKGVSTIKDADCVDKSYPGFWADMAGLGADIRGVL